MHDIGQKSLPRRQAQIANLVVAGKSSREIAETLSLSPRTVDNHLQAIFNKFGVGSRVELVVALLKLGPPEPGHPPVAPLRSADAQADGTLPVVRNRDATNLPISRTSLLGRESEIAEIVRILGESRLVTVTGAGGVGKTRTALAVGDAVLGDTENGVWLVELAPLAQGLVVAAAVARALSLPESPNTPLLETLLAYLKPKAQVLILDNCEHVIAEVADLAEALLRDCPKVRILATSREPLRVTGEQTHRLPSLTCPSARETVKLTTAGAAQYPAVMLFVQRASATDRWFALRDDNASTIGEICRRLDGIPLAIELAAARVKVLPVRALREQLDRRFRVLTSGDRSALPRHQTMRATLDWSYDLLEERDRTLFRRLGIFVNGFTLEGAFAVGTDDDFSDVDVFDALASLVDKSLLMADPHGESVRYHLLESTRVYAAEKLVAAGEREELARRHLRYFRNWFVELRWEFEQLRDGLDGTFATELDDVRVALDGARTRSEFVNGAELLAAIGAIGWKNSRLGREGIARCEAFLAELPRSENRLLGDLGVALTELLMREGRFAQAGEAAVAAVGSSRASGDGPIFAAALSWYALLLSFSRDFPAADRVLREAEAIEGLPPRLGLTLLDRRALISSETGDFDTAAHTYERLREKWRSAGFRIEEATANCNLALHEYSRGNYKRCTDLLCEAVSLCRNHDASAFLPSTLVVLALMLALTGAIEAAVGPAIEAIGILAPRQPGHYHISFAIGTLAYIATVHGDHDRAARLAGYADACERRLGYDRDDGQLELHERLMTSLREHLTAGELERLTTQGASLTPEAAIALARTLDSATFGGVSRGRSKSTSSTS